MQGDINDIIAKHLGLIFRQIIKFNLTGDQDAESIGYEALYNAILSYDESRSIAFSTYATVCIYNALGCHIRTLNKKRQIETVSYNNVAHSDERGDHDFLDVLSTDNDHAVIFMNRELCRIVRQEFDKLYGHTTVEKHRAILKEWNDSDFAMSTADIAKRTGVSQSYVSQVLTNFKHSLRKKMEVYY